jgi:transposase
VTTRARHGRDGLRFASDVTDAEWAVLAPLLPRPSRIGRRQAVARQRGGGARGLHRFGAPWLYLLPA